MGGWVRGEGGAKKGGRGGGIDELVTLKKRRRRKLLCACVCPFAMATAATAATPDPYERSATTTTIRQKGKLFVGGAYLSRRATRAGGGEGGRETPAEKKGPLATQHQTSNIDSCIHEPKRRRVGREGHNI